MSSLGPRTAAHQHWQLERHQRRRWHRCQRGVRCLGQRISAEAKGQGQEKPILNISALKSGLYFVQILSADGQTKIYKELVVQ